MKVVTERTLSAHQRAGRDGGEMAFADGAKPCPFCGHAPAIELWPGGGPQKRMISCSNEDCKVQPRTTGETRREALDNWNERYNSEGREG